MCVLWESNRIRTYPTDDVRESALSVSQKPYILKKSVMNKIFIIIYYILIIQNSLDISNKLLKI